MSQDFTSLIFEDSDTNCFEPAPLTDANVWILRIGSSFSFVISSFMIFLFIRFKELQRQPDDIMLGIAFSEFILSIHWLILYISPEKIADPEFCQAGGFLGVLGGMGELTYNVSFSFYLVNSIQNALRQDRIYRIRFHILSLSVSILLPTCLLSTDHIGLTSLGTCGLKTTCGVNVFNFIGPGFALLYGFTTFYTYYYLKKQTSVLMRAHAKRTQFLQYYLVYCITFLVTAVMNIVITIIANPNLKLYQNSWIRSLYGLRQILPSILFFIFRLGDPVMKRFIRKTLFFWRSTESPVLGSFLLSSPQESTKSSIEAVYTVLSCIMYANRLTEANSKTKLTQKTAEDQPKNRYKHEEVYTIEQAAIFADLPSVEENMKNTDYSILPGTLKVYSPGVFSELARRDMELRDILKSLDLSLNREEIARAYKTGDNGIAEEISFYSSNNHLVVKTVSYEELRAMIDMLENYEQHFEKNPNSLITKIYGVYSYENTNMELKYNLVLMKNACIFPTKCMKRMYDVNGSNHNRDVLGF